MVYQRYNRLYTYHRCEIKQWMGGKDNECTEETVCRLCPIYKEWKSGGGKLD